ncbi:MAG TPA: zinc ribbon domain-containing protein [Pirellulales bacterium]|nr:zinc ribbon domain-containing protein [Pirellulales bacterium]
MPYYEYKCNKCGTAFTIVQSFNEHERPQHPKCPGCGSKDVTRILSPVFVHTAKKS